MEWVDSFAERLGRLLQDGTLPKSALTSGMRRRMQSLIDMHAIVEQRVGSGARWILQNREAVERFATAQYPQGLVSNKPIVVFFSYTHDSDEHKAAVLALAQRLRREAIDARIDQLIMSPPEGWPAWMEREISRADFVLSICTEPYRRRAEGEEEPGKGKGAIWESHLIRKFLYEGSAMNHRFIPVVFQSGAPIPILLKDATYYRIPTDYELLYRRLTGQQHPVPEPLGPMRILSRRSELAVASTGAVTSELVQPVYRDPETSALAQKLAKLTARKEELIITSADTASIDKQILNIRRKLRDGVQLRPGDQLANERFRLIERVGQGGFASVWKAFDRNRQCLVAVKVLHPQHGEDRTRRERFFRGARAMAKLDHPSVVRIVLDGQQEGAFCFFVMEYLEDGDFHDAVLNQRLSRLNVLRIITQVAGALECAHQNGMVHRDVKPHNILLDKAGRPKLTDFDLVRSSDTTGGTRGDLLGTFVYAAPELLQSSDTVDGRADIFSLGMTFIFGLHGRDLPNGAFRAPDRFIPTNIPTALVEAIHKAVQWEPNARHSSAAAFASLLDTIEDQLDVLSIDRVSERAPSASFLLSDNTAHADS